jgi:DNA-binding MarR family transcriptional regulator
MTWTEEQDTEELLRILPLLNRVIGAEVRAVAGEETTMAQFRVLAQLAEEPRTLSVLARWRRVSLQAMSGVVQGLVERGWVERMPDPRDRRQQLLHLTGRGQAHYTQAQAHILDRLRPLLAALSPAELAAVAQALAALGRVFAPGDEDGGEGLPE